jgi:DNA polymerase
VETGEPQTVGFLQFDVQKPFLRMRVPSGRFVYYLRPKIEWITKKYANGDTKRVKQLTYEGFDKARRWCRMSTHGGRYAEQSTQTIARDVLAHGMLEAANDNFWIIGHVHDELIDEDDEDGSRGHHGLAACMARVPNWAKGLPLAAEGYTNPVYRKG